MVLRDAWHVILHVIVTLAQQTSTDAALDVGYSTLMLMYYLLIEFQHPKCLYMSIVVLSMFFLVVPNTWSINHQMGSEDRGFWPWRPPWRSPWTTSSLPGAWTSQARRCFLIFAKELSSSDLRNGLLRVGVKKATSTASQLFSTKFTAGLEHYLPLKETCLIFRTIDLKRSFIRDEFFW